MEIPIEHIQKTRVRVRATDPGSAPRLQGWMNKDIRLFGSVVSDKVREEFYRELHLMFSTGIDLRMALDIFASEMKAGKRKALFDTIKKRVVEGSTFSSALEQAGEFSKYEFHNIRIGEESGTLREVLKQLAEHFKNKTSQRKQLVGALSYPVLVLFTSLGAVAFMLRVVVPMFEDVFKRFGSDLPWLTKVVIRLSEWVGANALAFVAIMAVMALLAYMNRKKPWFREYSARLALRIPFFGEIVRSSQLGKFCSAMYLLISSRHPLVQSMAMVREMVGFYPIEKSLAEAEEQIIRGQSLSHSLANHRIYSGKMIALLKMAEEVNKLDVVFAQLRDQFNEDVKYRSALLSSVLEPLLIIFIGVMVGFILIAMYLPLFELSTSIG